MENLAPAFHTQPTTRPHPPTAGSGLGVESEVREELAGKWLDGSSRRAVTPFLGSKDKPRFARACPLPAVGGWGRVAGLLW